MRLIITGAGGFLGKNLVRNLTGDVTKSVRLIGEHVEQTVPDNEIVSDAFSMDLADPALVDLVDAGDTVIHLAWRSNPAFTKDDVEAELDLNWKASGNVIRVCAEKKAKLIFVSSGGTVYGRTQYSPIDENHPLDPISAYGKVKLKVEQEILKESQEQGLKYLILRPSNLYGPGFSTKKGLGVIGHWVKMAKERQPFQIVGDGNQTRDFIHADDLCQAIYKCLNLENDVLNVGTGSGVSLNYLHKTFEEVIGESIPVTHTPERDFDVTNNVLSIAKLEKLTGWRPGVSLRKGIESLINE